MCRNAAAPLPYALQADHQAGRGYGLILICLLVIAPVSRFGKAQSSTAGEVDPARPPLTTIRQAHDLSPQEAAQHVSVKLRGVVTAFSGWRDYFFLQDATGAIAINREEHALLHAGDEVEVTGVSDPGLFSTSVISHQVKVIGPGAMPVTRVSGYSDLEGGAKDAQWVQVRGVVQSAQIESIWDRKVLVLGLEMAGQQLSVRVFQFDDADVTRFVDAFVEVKGVCGTAYNDKRQFTGLRLFVADPRAITIVEPAPADPYEIEKSPIRSVMQFGNGRRARHRVDISGVVTYQDQGRSLYVQEGGDGILVFSSQHQVVVPGTKIEVLGFPALGEYSPVLKNATFRVVGGGTRVVPAAIRAADFSDSTKIPSRTRPTTPNWCRCAARWSRRSRCQMKTPG